MFHAYLEARQVGTLDGRTVWQLTSALPWSICNGFISGEAPVNFWTDYASVPRHFGMYLMFGGRCNRPAAGHDYTYRKGAVITVDLDKWPSGVDLSDESKTWLRRLPGTGRYKDPPRELADFIFLQLMIEDGEPVVVYKPMYDAVRVGGQYSYHKYCVTDPLPCERRDLVAA